MKTKDKANMALSLGSISDLHWWVTNLPTAFKAITIDCPTIEITTGASKLGWGQYNGQSAQGMWSFDEKQNHVNELQPAVFFGVKSRETCA